MRILLNNDAPVVVIGAGVIGLTVALRLQKLGHKVVIVARDFPAPSETIDSTTQINYTSPWAGAYNGWGKDLPGPGSTESEWRDHGFALTTFARMTQIYNQHAEAGLTFGKEFSYFDNPPDRVRELDQDQAAKLGIEDFCLLPHHELPEGVQLGYSYRTWRLNPMIYCSFLLRRFTIQGGTVIKRDLRCPEELFAMADFGGVQTVVNASGNGFGDPKVFITRGQTCLVANDCEVCVSRYYSDGASSYCIPRSFDGGTVIGGTTEPHNWDPAPTPGLRNELLKRIQETYPPILGDGSSSQFVPLTDIVGRRPTREGGMRVETEYLQNGKRIIHAYGAGGRGYEMSWGAADLVGQLY